MEIKTIDKDELVLLISGLRTLWVEDLEQRKVLERLHTQLSEQLAEHFGIKIP
jgi:hypothetical protein